MHKPPPLRCAGLHNLLPVIWRLYFNKLTKLNIQFLNKIDTRHFVRHQGEQFKLLKASLMMICPNIEIIGNGVYVLVEFSYYMYVEYKKRFLLKSLHLFKSDLINNMDNMRNSGTGPSLVILDQTN